MECNPNGIAMLPVSLMQNLPWVKQYKNTSILRALSAVRVGPKNTVSSSGWAVKSSTLPGPTIPFSETPSHSSDTLDSKANAVKPKIHNIGLASDFPFRQSSKLPWRVRPSFIQTCARCPLTTHCPGIDWWKIGVRGVYMTLLARDFEVSGSYGTNMKAEMVSYGWNIFQSL